MQEVYWIKWIYTERMPCKVARDDPCYAYLTQLEQQQIKAGGPPITIYYTRERHKLLITSQSTSHVEVSEEGVITQEEVINASGRKLSKQRIVAEQLER